MAEFCEVMHNWIRMCRANIEDITNNGPVTGFVCDKCPLSALDLDRKQQTCLLWSLEWVHGIEEPMADSATCRNVEHEIMNWAYKNPEPVYPEWIEWLKANDIWKNLHSRIPADIAKKLGIKPEEVKAKIVE